MGFKIGDKVTFKAGPRSRDLTTAEVIGEDNGFLVTKDISGKERKVRPASCSKTA